MSARQPALPMDMPRIKPARLPEEPTEPWAPSNGTDGESFMGRWCGACRKVRRCSIPDRAMAYRIGEKGYPKQWVRTPGDYFSARCTAFDPVRPR